MGALLGGLVIGAVVGGVSYALQHRGQPLACFLQDPDFWRAVAIGGVSGTVSGFVAGFFAPLMLLSSGVGTAMQIGGLIGMLSSFSSHVVTNVLYGRPVAEGLGWAMLSGAVFGALGGALGYWAQQARLQPTSQPSTGNSSTPVDLHAFGGKTTGPRPPRVGRDLFPNASGMVGPERPPFPNGASTFADPGQAPLTGHYHTLPKGTQLPSGLGVIADGIDVNPISPNPATHHTLYPTEQMPIERFMELFEGLHWVYGGKK